MGHRKADTDETTQRRGPASPAAAPSQVAALWGAAVLLVGAVEVSPNQSLTVVLWGQRIERHECGRMRALMESRRPLLHVAKEQTFTVLSTTENA